MKIDKTLSSVNKNKALSYLKRDMVLSFIPKSNLTLTRSQKKNQDRWRKRKAQRARLNITKETIYEKFQLEKICPNNLRLVDMHGGNTENASQASGGATPRVVPSGLWVHPVGGTPRVHARLQAHASACAHLRAIPWYSARLRFPARL